MGAEEDSGLDSRAGTGVDSGRPGDSSVLPRDSGGWQAGTQESGETGSARGTDEDGSDAEPEGDDGTRDGPGGTTGVKGSGGEKQYPKYSGRLWIVVRIIFIVRVGVMGLEAGTSTAVGVWDSAATVTKGNLMEGSAAETWKSSEEGSAAAGTRNIPLPLRSS